MSTHQTLSDALKALPADAVWSASFGNPGESGYSEYHRASNGRRFRVDRVESASITWAVTQDQP